MKPTLADINDWFNRNVKEIDESKTPELSNEIGDYWQTPAETIMHLRGDCEDYAIAKLYTLLEYGHNPEDWEIHAVRLNGFYHGKPHGTLINHAVLVNVKDGWVLDNLAREITTKASRVDIVETYATISVVEPSHFTQWRDMLKRRDVILDSKLIREIFG